MQLKIEELAKSLTQNPQSVYLISGDEIYQSQQAVMQIIQHAKKDGYHINRTVNIENDDSWLKLANNNNNMSFFSQKELHKVAISKNKVSKLGQDVISNFLKDNNTDILIITCKKLTAAEKKLAWIKKVTQQAIIITIWPLYPNQMPLWIKNQLKKINLTATTDAIELIANHTQNNLIAADQTITKLGLVFTKKNINAQDVIDSIFQQSNYSCYDLLDALLLTNDSRILVILSILKQEPQQINILLYLIIQELTDALTNKNITQSFFNKNKINRMKKINSIFSKQQIFQLISYTREIEKSIKGCSNHEPWQLLTKLCLKINGNKNIL